MYDMARKTKCDAELTRQHLLDAAEMLFLERGVSRTSLQDIATAAGTTRGAVYWHFQDKADLFNAMMERVVLPLEQALEMVTDATPCAEGSPIGRLLDTLQAALHATVNDPQMRRVFTIATHKVEYVAELQAVADRRLQAMTDVVACIEKAIEQTLTASGQRMSMPTHVAAMGLHMLIDGLFNHWLLAPESFDLEDVGRETLRNYVRGLGLK
jgi:TetR/AcrR family acrAB operon transcriptional repressor